MKKILTSIIIVILTIVLCGYILLNRDIKVISAQIYYVDHSMLRLIPINLSFEKTTTKKAANKIVEKLIEGNDKNSKILRVIPHEEGCMSVKLDGNTAIVDLKNSFIKNKPENKIHGLLAVYSIVNSLTSIEGIDTVQFYINGKEDKGFIRDLDMRETFIPDYYL